MCWVSPNSKGFIWLRRSFMSVRRAFCLLSCVCGYLSAPMRILDWNLSFRSVLCFAFNALFRWKSISYWFAVSSSQRAETFISCNRSSFAKSSSSSFNALNVIGCFCIEKRVYMTSVSSFDWALKAFLIVSAWQSITFLYSFCKRSCLEVNTVSFLLLLTRD